MIMVHIRHATKRNKNADHTKQYDLKEEDGRFTCLGRLRKKRGTANEAARRNGVLIRMGVDNERFKGGKKGK